MLQEEETAARAELWKSLVRQLKSSLVAKEASGELAEALLEELFDWDEVGLWTKDAYLSIWLHTNDGKGSWSAGSYRLDAAGPWFMSVDGKIDLDGEVMNVMSAADRFIEKLS